MENIKNILRIKQVKKANRTNWQLEAVDCINKLADGRKNVGAIFRCFKIDSNRARIAMLDSLELSKPFSKYFFKVFSELKKNRDNLKELKVSLKNKAVDN